MIVKIFVDHCKKHLEADIQEWLNSLPDNTQIISVTQSDDNDCWTVIIIVKRVVDCKEKIK